jgi:hypothetical protein
MLMLGGFSVCMAVFTFMTRHLMPLLYSEDAGVLLLAADAIQIYSVYLCFSCGIWAVRCSLNGCAKQPTSAKIAILSAYLVGVPSAALCCFWLRWGVNGLWTGLTLGNMAAVAMLLHKVGHIDWPAESLLARERALGKQAGGTATTTAAGDKKSVYSQVADGDDDDSDVKEGSREESRSLLGSAGEVSASEAAEIERLQAENAELKAELARKERDGA